jgi:DNA-binding ferritin-like protein
MIFDYKDELNDHFEDVNERILMVGNECMNIKAAV